MLILTYFKLIRFYFILDRSPTQTPRKVIDLSLTAPLQMIRKGANFQELRYRLW